MTKMPECYFFSRFGKWWLYYIMPTRLFSSFNLWCAYKWWWW